MLLSFILSFFWSTVPCFAENTTEPSTQTQTISLIEAIRLAKADSFDLKAKSEKLKQAQATLEKAESLAYPKFVATAILSPIFKATGDATYSENDLSTWGTWLQSTVMIIQPVYTWGRISSLKKAASHGVEAATEEFRKNRLEILHEIKKVYYGAVLAEQLYNFLGDAKDKLSDVEKTALKEQKNSKKNQMSKRDFFRIQLFKAEAEARFEEAKNLRSLARRGLSVLVGRGPAIESVPAETSLEAVHAPKPDFKELARNLKATKPEIKQLGHAIAAKIALLESEKAGALPAFFVGGLLNFNHSGVRTRQGSAFANDPYNRHTGGFGIGLQWNFDLALVNATKHQLQAEIKEIEFSKELAENGLELNLEKNIQELVLAEKMVGTFQGAFETSKKWLSYEAAAFDMGTKDYRNLGDAFLAKAKASKDYWESIYKLNLAWSNLSVAVGQDLDPITKNENF